MDRDQHRLKADDTDCGLNLLAFAASELENPACAALPEEKVFGLANPFENRADPAGEPVSQQAIETHPPNPGEGPVGTGSKPCSAWQHSFRTGLGAVGNSFHPERR